jgi:hypothetical protein
MSVMLVSIYTCVGELVNFIVIFILREINDLPILLVQ